MSRQFNQICLIESGKVKKWKSGKVEKFRWRRIIFGGKTLNYSIFEKGV
jgi:hypothetical protein